MIAYYGGGFDPIHNGHLHAARVALELFGLEEVRFILTARPVHKNVSGRGVRARWEMLERALEDQMNMHADDLEISSPEQHSFTYNTLLKLRDKHGAAKPLLWLMGSDQFAVLESWYRGLELISLAHIVVFARPAHASNEIINKRMRRFSQLHITQNVQQLTSSPAGKLYFSDQLMLDVSSTQIRESLKQGTSVRHQLPESVLSYIMENQLYQTGVSE